MKISAEDYVMCMYDEDTFVTCTNEGHLKVWSIDEEEEIMDNDEIFEEESYQVIAVVPYEDTILTFAENNKMVKKWDIHCLSLLGEIELRKPVQRGLTTSICGDILHLASERNIYKIELEEFEIVEDYWDRNFVTCMNNYSGGHKNIYITSEINVQARENKNEQLWSSYFSGEKINAVISEHNNVLFVLGKPDEDTPCSISIYSLRNFFKYGKVTLILP